MYNWVIMFNMGSIAVYKLWGLKHWRVQTCFTKKGEVNAKALSVLPKGEADQLCVLLARYPDVLAGCVLDLEVQSLVMYVRELATEFHSYYGRVRLLGGEVEEELARLALIKSVRIVLEDVLTLLGVRAPESM